MKIRTNEPPRLYRAGLKNSVTIADCGRIELEADEQVTFVTEAAAEYDVCRKSWGFYATPSTNGRLKDFGLRAVLVRNVLGRYFVMLVERAKEAEFHAYLESEQNVVVTWLDDSQVLNDLFGGDR